MPSSLLCVLRTMTFRFIFVNVVVQLAVSGKELIHRSKTVFAKFGDRFGEFLPSYPLEVEWWEFSPSVKGEHCGVVV